jgi:glucose-6-phosphate 1-epimerase
VSPRSLETPAPALGLSHQSGARAAVYPDGALLFTWWPAQGSEVLFMSSRAEPKVGVSPHGGAPIIFPQFGGEGPLPSHGFARTLRWESMPRDTMTCLSMRLTDSPATREVWPHAFSAEHTVTLGDRDVAIQLEVTNTGDTAMRFTCALHTYLRVGDVGSVALCGLEGSRYRDKLLGEERTEESSRLAIPESINRIYFDTPAQLVLDDPSLGRTISVQADGFTDTVVWNPGEEGALAYADLAPGDHRHFLCVESARIGTPVEVLPGKTWMGRQTLKI